MKQSYSMLLMVLAFAFLAESLHLHDASSNYISYLQGQQNIVKAKLDTISQRLSQNYRQVQNQNDIDKKIALLEKYLKEQRLLLAEINLQTVNQQLDQSQWVCPVLSDNSKRQISDDIYAINKDLDDINKVLALLSDEKFGPGVETAKQEIKGAEKTADNLKNALDSKGSQVESSLIHPEKKPNLNTLNWVLDGKSIDELNKQYKKAAESGAIQICGIQEPFYSKKVSKCIACTGFNKYFSMRTSQCIQCSNFDAKEHQCRDKQNSPTNITQKKQKSFYSNMQDPNWASTLSYPQIQKDIEEKTKNPLYEKCPVQKPFSTGKQCIQCSSDQHFDYDKKQCAKCYNGQTFNRNLHKCTYTQNNFQTNPQKTSNLIFEGRPKNEWMYIYYQKIQQNEGMTDCPKEKPYFDGLSCIICPSEHPYFNLEYKMCQKCLEGTKYEEVHHECLTTQGNIATQVPTLEKMAAGIFS